MSGYYKWWEDENRTILVFNKGEMAQGLGVSLKTIDDWCRKGAPVFRKGGNGVEYQLDAVAFVEWSRAFRLGISIAELRRRDEADPVHHLLCAMFEMEITIAQQRAELEAVSAAKRG